MQIKLSLKIGFLSLALLLIIGGGINLFYKLKSNRDTLLNNIYTSVPSDISSILQINKEKDIKELSPYFGKEYADLIIALKDNLNYPFLHIQKESEKYILSKITPEQEKNIKNILRKKLFSSHPPMEKDFRGSKLLFYTTDNKSFFVCSFYEGIFVGSYNLNSIENFIEFKNKNQPGLQLDKKEIARDKTTYPASLFLNANNTITYYHIAILNNKLNLFRNIEQQKTDSSTILPINLKKIDYSIFPSFSISYEIYKDKLLINKMSRYFFLPSYKFETSMQSPPIYALKCKESKYLIYQILNKYEEQYIKKRFNTEDFYSNYRVYSTSTQMGQEIFNFKKQAYITFYKDYLIFSENKNNLIQYLKNPGQNTKIESINFNTDPNISSIYYSNDLKKEHPDYFNPYNPISEHYNNRAYFLHINKEGTTEEQISF